MAKSGAQPGNNNASKNRPWREALKRALARKHGDVTSGLISIAQQVVTAANQGEKWAIEEIGNRVEGRAVQTIESSGPEGGPIQVETTQRPSLSKEEWLKTHGLEVKE
jgi:hypothetical protein